MNRDDIVTYINELLNISEIKDDSHNGLQFKGKSEVNHIAISVDGCLEVFNETNKINADFLIVHHGIFWNRTTVEMINDFWYNRLSPLFKNDINLYGVHLPLDAHPIYGNNAYLNKILDFDFTDRWGTYNGIELGYIGEIEKTDIFELKKKVDTKLDTNSKLYLFNDKKISKIAICSGGGASLIQSAAEINADLFLTGEIGHSNYHIAKEYGINLLVAGHYKTEVGGVKLLGSHLAEKFGLKLSFIDVPTDL